MQREPKRHRKRIERLQPLMRERSEWPLPARPTAETISVANCSEAEGESPTHKQLQAVDTVINISLCFLITPEVTLRPRQQCQSVELRYPAKSRPFTRLNTDLLAHCGNGVMLHLLSFRMNVSLHFPLLTADYKRLSLSFCFCF